MTKFLKNGMEGVKKTAGGLSVVFCDETCLVVEKPAGVLTHATSESLSQHTLVNEIRPFIDFPANDYKAGIAHRLDRDTSGLVLCGRTPVAKENLQKLFKNREIKKSYFAIVSGRVLEPRMLLHFMMRDENERMKRKAIPFMDIFEDDEGVPLLEDALERSAEVFFAKDNFTKQYLQADDYKKIIKRQFQGESLKLAITSIAPLAIFSKHIFLDVNIKTGRTHQIRAQLAQIRMPICGDTVYGVKNGVGKGYDLQTPNENLFLHAYKLVFRHPETEKELVVESKLPGYFKNKLNQLRAETTHEELIV